MIYKIFLRIEQNNQALQERYYKGFEHLLPFDTRYLETRARIRRYQQKIADKQAAQILARIQPPKKTWWQELTGR